MLKKQILVGVCIAALSASASAALLQYDFSYTLSGGGVLSGSLMGELQANNDTIVVSSILDFAMFNSVAGPGLPFVTSLTEFFGGGAVAPIVSLSGSTMDLLACTSNACNNGFFLETTGLLGGGPSYGSGVSFGRITETFIPGNWSITAANAVPEPLPLALVGLALAGLALQRRAQSARG